MKIKKIIIALLVLPLFITLVSCDDSDKIQIGIVQYAEFPALSSAREGFIDGLAEAGYVDGENIKINYDNAQKDGSILKQISKQVVRRNDLILCIATPVAISVVNEAREQGKEVPILFTAVTNPVVDKLITSNENPGGFVTGTNDMNPVARQISLVKEIMPSAKTLGIIYNASESNSQHQAELAKVEAGKLGLEVKMSTIHDITELGIAVNDLTNKIDVLYVPTDNLIASSINTVIEITTEKKIPVIAGEEGLVNQGSSITYSIDYYRLGKETAKMAVQILKDGTSPKDIPSIGLSEFLLVINKKKFDQMGLTISEELLSSADKVIE